jgi:hypothetical protein
MATARKKTKAKNVVPELKQSFFSISMNRSPIYVKLPKANIAWWHYRQQTLPMYTRPNGNIGHLWHIFSVSSNTNKVESTKHQTREMLYVTHSGGIS